MSGLVLERRCHQVIMIGDNIRITVVEAKFGRARIRIEAPHDVQVWREEIAERIKAESENAL